MLRGQTVSAMKPGPADLAVLVIALMLEGAGGSLDGVTIEVGIKNVEEAKKMVQEGKLIVTKVEGESMFLRVKERSRIILPRG